VNYPQVTALEMPGELSIGDFTATITFQYGGNITDITGAILYIDKSGNYWQIAATPFLSEGASEMKLSAAGVATYKMILKGKFAGGIGEGFGKTFIFEIAVAKTGWQVGNYYNKNVAPENQPAPDAGVDAGVDAGIDAGKDAGQDAGVDAGYDASVVGCQDYGGKIGWMCTVPAGSFQMGCNCASFDGGPDSGCVDNQCSPDEYSYHTVTFLNTYKMDKFEVTVDQYAACITADGGCTTPGTSSGCNWGMPDAGMHPINCVDWNQSGVYCAWVGKRLPSEAEWQKAARAGTTTKYYCGNDESCVVDIAWYDSNSGNKTHPVGQKQANNYYLYDMLGNVWEWVEDDWHVSYEVMTVPPRPDDGTVWKYNPRDPTRVICGGSYLIQVSYSRVSSRIQGGTGTTYTYRDLGFRCAQ